MNQPNSNHINDAAVLASSLNRIMFTLLKPCFRIVTEGQRSRPLYPGSFLENSNERTNSILAIKPLHFFSPVFFLTYSSPHEDRRTTSFIKVLTINWILGLTIKLFKDGLGALLFFNFFRYSIFIRRDSSGVFEFKNKNSAP